MAYKTKISTDEKLRIVREYKAGETTLGVAADQLGVDRKTGAGWIHLYDIGGEDALLPPEHLTMYSPELKLKAVKDYLSGKGSLSDVCKAYKIRNPIQLREWLKVYNAHGKSGFKQTSSGGSLMSKARNTTQEERIQIAIECIATGRNYSDIAAKYQVSYQQVRIWTQRFEELGESGLEDRRGQRKKDQEPRTELEKAQIEIEQLKHKLYLAEMENALLKKVDEVERRDAYRK